MKALRPIKTNVMHTATTKSFPFCPFASIQTFLLQSLTVSDGLVYLYKFMNIEFRVYKSHHSHPDDLGLNMANTFFCCLFILISSALKCLVTNPTVALSPLAKHLFFVHVGGQ